jgi:acetolactate synthase I/II/III large subunit
MNASDLFIKALENEGVERIYGVPGEENLDFLESLRKSKIELILTRHEQGAAFMAATYGRFTGKVGVCIATLGPGATNLVTGAAYAQLGAMPMLMITGQKPIKQSKQGRFQIVDVIDMMRPLTKFTRQIVDAKMIPSLVREAHRLATEERPGAVHLELPEDVAREAVDPDIHVFEVSRVRRPDADIKLIDEAVKLIQAAKYPLILIGAGANRKRISKALLAFVEKTRIPFFDTQMGKGVINEDHPLFLGTAALSAGDYLHCAIDKSDLIINVGHDVVEKPPFFMEPGGKKVIHVNFASAVVDNVYFPQIEIVGDIATTMTRLTERIGDCSSHDFSYFQKVISEVNEQIREKSNDASFPMKPQRFVADVRKVMADEGVIALDNGVYKIWFARNYKAKASNTVLLDNALATMGAGLPSAMEAARLFPSKKVMAICGDGGFMMNSQELETAIRLKLNLIVLILRDDSYGMIRWKQYGMGFPDFGLTYGNPDFVKYAESYGAKGHRVTKTETFVSLLEDCLKTGGVHLVELAVDYSENNKVLIDELKDKVCLI